MSKTGRWILGIACVLGLIGLRFFEEALFFDPLYEFYQGPYLKITHAFHFAVLKSIYSISLRYLLNSILSLLIIYAVFPFKKIMRFSFWFYGGSYIFLFLLFGLAAHKFQPEEFLVVFYIRRFLIQPLLLLLLLPAFFYQRKKAKGEG